VTAVSNSAVSIPDALAAFSEQWQPHRLTSVNDHDVKIARIQGEFVWHAHPDSDELFMVVSGELTIQLRQDQGGQRDVVVGPSEIYVVPAGVEHCPKSEVETVIVMVEKAGTVNTGDAGGTRTAELRELG
jgi:mannose-6-phosphate isomerase-like protein (cupin superfamily)